MYNRITEVLEELVFNKEIEKYMIFRDNFIYEISINHQVPIKIAFWILNEITKIGYADAINSIEYTQDFVITFDIQEIDRINESEGKKDIFSFIDVDLLDKENEE